MLFRGALLVLCSVVAFAAEPHWFRMSTAGFEVYSSSPESDTRRVLQYLERAKSFFDQQTHAGIQPRAGRVRVVMFGSKKEYHEYRFKQFAAGYSTQIDGRDYIVLSAAENEMLPTAVHEYIHLTAQETSQRLPPWLSEGFAEVYSTLKFSGGRVVVGLPPPARVQALGRDAWVPLAEILNADHESPYYSQTGMAGILYNEGWALVHMLAFHPRYAPDFPKLLEAIEQGTRSRDALERIYGKPLATIERELKSYLGHGLFASRTIQTKLPTGGAAAFEPAAMYDVKLALLDLASRVGNAADTRAGLVSLVREDPRRPEPHVALGYLLVRSFHEEDAFRSFQTAVNLGSRDPQMLWDYGRLAAAKLPEQAMSALRLLLADQPARSDARLELAEILMSRRRPREALEILEPVTTVAPESTAKLNEVLAMANLEVGNRDQALEHARHWLAAEHDASRRLNANRIVRYLDETSRAE